MGEIYDAVSKDFNRIPIKPILHGEGVYEEGPEYPTKPITPLIIRKQMYRAMFAGGMHTYGNNSVWNFGTNPEYVQRDWKEALKSPGARQLTIARDFFESQDWWNMVPDQSIIVHESDSINHLDAAMRSEDGNKIIVYLSENQPLNLDLSKFSGKAEIKTNWINPENGQNTDAEEITGSGVVTFTPPSGWQDALLVLGRD